MTIWFFLPYSPAARALCPSCWATQLGHIPVGTGPSMRRSAAADPGGLPELCSGNTVFWSFGRSSDRVQNFRQCGYAWFFAMKMFLETRASSLDATLSRGEISVNKKMKKKETNKNWHCFPRIQRIHFYCDSEFQLPRASSLPRRRSWTSQWRPRTRPAHQNLKGMLIGQFANHFGVRVVSESVAEQRAVVLEFDAGHPSLIPCPLPCRELTSLKNTKYVWLNPENKN